ncbi:MAG: hypothetical protein UH080_07570 [Ruminococcus sp.]|nr:hypothetical protein [Ruminococcus sp.]
MKKIYLDETQSDCCTAVFVSDAEVIRAGATVYSMPVSDKNDEYKRLAEDYDVRFIFDDNPPAINFYTIPLINIFATDSNGGYIASLGQIFDIESNAPICYIDSDKKCYVIAENGKEFLKNISNWKDKKELINDIKFYYSKEEAEKENEFLDIKELEKSIRGENYD